MLDQPFGPPVAWVAWRAPTPQTVAEEVRELRDRIVGCTGLSRQEIARAIGVNRRSLSGYVSGEIRPTDDRIRALRELAEIAEWSVARFGEHARELLRGGLSGRRLVDLTGEQGMTIRRTLEADAHTRLVAGSPAIRIKARPTRPSLHVHALSVWAEESRLPERGGTPREISTYEQDLRAAPRAPDPQDRPRRRQI
jgi:transcriptional regulator with XRE-family HTH domain